MRILKATIHSHCSVGLTHCTEKVSKTADTADALGSGHGGHRQHARQISATMLHQLFFMHD
jgi:hypothetical protein